MPDYDYCCRVCAQVMTVNHAAGELPMICCEACGGEVYRKYRSPRVNWNGPPPSAGELHPEIKAHIDNQQQRREEFEAAHEAHEARRKT